MPTTDFINQVSIDKPEGPYKEDLNSVNKTLNKMQNISKAKHFGIIALAIFAAGAIIFAAFSFLTNQDGPFVSPIGRGRNSSDAKDSVQSPITGEMFGKEEGTALFSIRPLAVMVNNHIDARPQSGLIYADLVYEIVAEGGITRFLAFFNSDIPEKIGPVRSTREYYLVLVKELGDAMLMHIGWSPQALEAIETWPVRSLGRGGGEFWRDNPRGVAIEHTAYTNGVDLIKTGIDLGWGGIREFKVWSFKDNTDEYNESPTASKITIDFWYPGDYTAAFEYDASSNSYMRFMGYDANDNLIPHVDQETKEQIKVKNLIVQFVKEDSIAEDEKGRLDYQLVGSGKGIVFIDGRAVDVTWNKPDRDGRTVYYDLNGNEMKFNRGQFWISVVPDRNVEQVVYN